jgi:NAD(P)-dependent dehydrogenase (short-subunit alcohol dehydrogenase family)
VTLKASATARLRPSVLFSLLGRVALVTGAAGGLGAWFAAGLAAAGARVVLADRDVEVAMRVCETLAGRGHECSALGGDLADPAVPSELVGQVVDMSGRLDVVVNNAAINERARIFDVDVETLDRVGAVNLRAPYLLARAAAEVMRGQGGGSIINIGSINSVVGLEGVSVYGAYKAALTQLTKVMSVEWIRHGIRVNCIAPGFMLTPLSRPLWEDSSRRRWLLDRTPMRRPGRPDELVGLCVLLASDAGSYIAGTTIYVDGGFLAGTPWQAEPDGDERDPGGSALNPNSFSSTAGGDDPSSDSR